MKTIFALLLLLVSFSVLAQNGGQSNEHGSLKISYRGYSSAGEYLLELEKKSCDGSVIVSLPLRKDTSISLGQGTHQLKIKGVFVSNAVLKAKTNDNCGERSNSGWVEVRAAFMGVLPIRIVGIQKERINERIYKVSVTLLNPDGDSKAFLRVTADRVRWRRIEVPIEKSSEPKTYSVFVNL